MKSKETERYNIVSLFMNNQTDVRWYSMIIDALILEQKLHCKESECDICEELQNSINLLSDISNNK